MPYIVEEFEGVQMPPAMTEDDLGVGHLDSSLLDSVGGAYDYWGGAQRLPRRGSLKHKGIFVAANGDADGLWRAVDSGDLRVTSTGDLRVTALDKLQDLQGRTDALKAMIGVRGKLWRRRIQDGQRTWKLCRLLGVRHEQKIDNADVISEVETDWETTDAGWRAADLATVQGTGAIVNLAVANAGTVPISDAVIRIARSTGTITQIAISALGVSLGWAGSLGAGQTLVIDCGRQTVTIGASNAYSGYSLQSGHTVDGWLPLRTGVTAVIVAATGGTVTASVEMYPQWA